MLTRKEVIHLPLQCQQEIPVHIVHWNRPDECLRTVHSFLDQNMPIRIRVLDNGSQQAKFLKLKESLPPCVEIVRSEVNRGWGGGHNILLRQWLDSKESEYCFVSAHDTILYGNCLQALVGGMKNNPHVGILCPEYGIPELPRYSPVRGPYSVTIAARVPHAVEIVDYAHQTLVMFRKQCLAEIGLYDEQYFAYGDDYDISLRARKYGWQAAIAWGAVITNPGTWTAKAELSYLFARNTLRLAAVHGGCHYSVIRAFLMLLNLVRFAIADPTEQKTKLYRRARLRGICDFFLGHFGPPPRWH